MNLVRCLLSLLAASLPALALGAGHLPTVTALPGMVWIPGGASLMGSNDFFPEERPVHEVDLDGFFIDRHEVTNRRFLAFVRARGYVTLAERLPGPAGGPPGSLVFRVPSGIVSLREVQSWWRFVVGASWRHPEGPGSGIAQRMDHPVVHVAWQDAAAFCTWASGRLPTEAQWERAARGGFAEKTYIWGAEARPGGRWMANVWQGPFPAANSAADGWAGTAPVGSYPPNGYGLYDMAGNVWEWTRDWYRYDYYTRSERRNPLGPDEASSLDPGEPGVRKRTTRGGSFLCATSYCLRYRPSARSPLEPQTSLVHTGFRCARDDAR